MSTESGSGVEGTLHTTGGRGRVRMERMIDTDEHDLWSALTDPARLARWYGEVEGDLRAGGDFRAQVLASGWQGSGRVDVCEPPHRLVVTSQEVDAPDEEVVEVTLIPRDGGTALVLDQRGLPLEQLAAYGAGLQVHVEDLAAHVAGRGRAPATRWAELFPTYQALPVTPDAPLRTSNGSTDRA